MEAKISILSLALSLLLWRNVHSMPQWYISRSSSGGGSATACCTINGVYRCYQSGSSGFVSCGGGTNGVSFTFPTISIPKFVIPTMPTFNIPSFNIPSFNIPSFSGFGSSGSSGGSSSGSSGGGSSTACCTINGVYRCYQSGSSGFVSCGGGDEGDNDEDTEYSNGEEESSAGEVGGSGGSSTACCTINGVYRCYQSGSSGFVSCGGGNQGSQNIAIPSFTFPTMPTFTFPTMPSFTFPTIPTFAGGGSGGGGSGTACCTINGVTKCYQSGSSGYASCSG